MIEFIQELKARNEALFYFSLMLVVMSIAFYMLTKITTTQVAGVNAWFKPFKFAVSIAVYCSTMAWFCHEPPAFNITAFNWTNISLFTFEIVYIAVQAARGEGSHFNQTTPFHAMMFAAMGVAAVLIAIYGAYVGIMFFQSEFPNIPEYYVWAIRLSIPIFFIFSLEGLLMGARQTHTVGMHEQTTFLPIFKWNMKEGDLRVAHFIGMHAIQIIPLASFYVLKSTKAVFALSALYLLFAAFVLVQALQSKSFIKSKRNPYEAVS